MAREYFYVKYYNLLSDFGIMPKCNCYRLHQTDSTYTVTTTTMLSETTNRNLITSLNIVCNLCKKSTYINGLATKLIYEEQLDWD